MALVAETQYYAKLITVDKQGNQTTGPQQAIIADAVHNADMHPDLQQNFHAHGANQTLYGSSSSANVVFTTLDFESGSGSYSTSTGQFTVGQTGKMIFFAQVELVSVGPPAISGGSLVLSFLQSGSPTFYGPIATWIQDPLTAGSFKLTATASGALSVTSGQIIAIEATWERVSGVIGPTGTQSAINTYFEGHITPG